MYPANASTAELELGKRMNREEAENLVDDLYRKTPERWDGRVSDLLPGLVWCWVEGRKRDRR